MLRIVKSSIALVKTISLTVKVEINPVFADNTLVLIKPVFIVDTNICGVLKYCAKVIVENVAFLPGTTPLMEDTCNP